MFPIQKLTAVIFLLAMLSYPVMGQEGSDPSIEQPYLIESIYFRGGSYHIDPEQRDKVVKFLQDQLLENFEIHIHSHTDPIGGKEYNQWLSRMRSESAYRMLEREGIIMNNVFIKDHDFTNPDFDNNTREGRLRNRRVDIVLWPLPS